VVLVSLVSFVSGVATASDTNNEQGQQYQQPHQLQLLRHQRRRSLVDPNKPSLNSDKDGPQTGESIAQEDDTDTTTTTTTGRIDDAESSNKEEEEDEDDDEDDGSSTSVLPVIPNIDEQELNRCLQRKDLEEVYGRSAGVVCTCINMAPDQLRMTTTMTTTSSVAADDDSNDDNTTTTTSSSSSTAMEVNIVVRLTCTDNKSRDSPNSAQGDFTYCLPKSERCDPSDTRDGLPTSQCCGDRVCDVQRRECIATPESILGIRSNGNNTTTGGGNDGDDEDEEESAVVSIKIGYDSNGNDRGERDTLLSERKQELLRAGEGHP
jgi:hypothetical protein